SLLSVPTATSTIASLGDISNESPRGHYQRVTTDLRKTIAKETRHAASGLRDEIRALQEAHQHMRDGQRDLRREVRLLRAVIAANTTHRLEQHASAMDPVQIRPHVASAIAAAHMELTPTPHLVVEDVFPAATYLALLAATPPDECFSDRDAIKQNFRYAPDKIVPDVTAAMWSLMERDIIPTALVPSILGRFRPHIEAVYQERHGARAAEVLAVPHAATAGRLLLRRPGYHLDPHLDPQRAVVTCLLYLANPGDSPEHGTQLFSLNATPEVTGTKTFYPDQAGYVSTLVKTVPFRPNTALAFMNSGAAAHGATIPASAPADTKRYAYQFYISPEPRQLSSIIGGTPDDQLN
ncbi:MAG: hypothetical protein ABL986_06380, partial [Vicinamibacterales bacterium]